MSVIETEIKFRVADAAALEQSLRETGFRQLTPRTFERNVLFDTPDRRLRQEHSILRIRSYGGSWVLTHKAIPQGGETDPKHKQRIETETTVADGETLSSVFEALGFAPAFTYEKWRTEWADATGHCVIDETPIGLFAELEGPADWIDMVASSLGIAPEACLTLSYGRLFELWVQETGSSATDLTFAAIPSPVLQS